MARRSSDPSREAAHKQFQALEEGKTVDIFHNGELQANVADGNEAFRWLLDHQSQSLDWAIFYEGWEVKSHPTLQYYPCQLDMKTGKINVRVSHLMEVNEAEEWLKIHCPYKWGRCEAIPQPMTHEYFKGMDVKTKDHSRMYWIHKDITRAKHE